MNKKFSIFKDQPNNFQQNYNNINESDNKRKSKNSNVSNFNKKENELLLQNHLLIIMIMKNSSKMIN